MDTKIKWNEGDGHITATYNGSGNGLVQISSDLNEGIDREQHVKVETTDKTVSVQLTVSQPGLREIFAPSDGEFILNSGGTFNVLKNKIPEEPDDSLIPMGVSIATTEGLFIPYNDWNKQGTAVGVSIKTEKVSFIMGLKGRASKAWNSTGGFVQEIPSADSSDDASKYTDGVEYTNILYNESPSTTYAAGYANSFTITIGEKTLTGYVGSSGEWAEALRLYEDVLAAAALVNLDLVGNYDTSFFWSSVQYGEANAWRAFWRNKSNQFYLASYSKKNTGKVLPFFKYE